MTARAVATKLTSMTMYVTTRLWARKMLCLAQPVERRTRLTPLPMTSIPMKSLIRLRIVSRQ